LPTTSLSTGTDSRGRYNQTAQQLNWKFTAANLTLLLRRISEREQQTASQADLVMAADNPRRTYGATH
jgi:hypothetical protein